MPNKRGLKLSITKARTVVFKPYIAIHSEWWKYCSWSKPAFFNENGKKKNGMENIGVHHPLGE